MQDLTLTVIIPVFNEEDNLARIESIFLNYFKTTKYKTTVLFVDDGSTDCSFDRIENICRKNSSFEFIKFRQNEGLSAAIKAGINNCDADLLGYIDADLQTDVYDFNSLLEHIHDFDAVVGYRAKRKDTLNKKFQSLLANTVRRALINDGIIDTGCPLKIIKTDIAKGIPFFDGMHRFLPALIQLQGGKVKQIPVKHYKRLAGKSKFNIFNRSIRPLVDAFAYRWMKKRYISYDIEKQFIAKNIAHERESVNL